MAGEHPMAWRHKLGEGRVFYAAIGHQTATYDIAEFQNLNEAAVLWAGELVK
ncbi:ThuA domain-containing protein [Zhongshania sp.]|uniref:ThuA domain-containing protein n=1 Tax=Zhongshania sp. TaxID=1971902 RepID=UPI003562AEE6